MTGTFTTKAQADRNTQEHVLQEPVHEAWMLSEDPLHASYSQEIDGTRSVLGNQQNSTTGELDDSKTETEQNALAMLGLGDEQEEPPRPSHIIDLKRLILGVWQRKLMVVGIASVITLLFLLAAIFLVSKTWTSSSVLIKREQVDQFQIGGGNTPFELQNYSFQTMLDTLKLPSLLQIALERSKVEAKTTQFSSAIGLSKGKTSNLFQIKVTWDDPVVAATLTNNLVTVFIENNRTMRRQEASSIFNYYQAQLTEVERNAENLDRQIQDFQRDNNVINFDKQTEVALRKIGDLEIEYRSLMAELNEIKRNEGALSDLIQETPEMTIQTTLYTNPLKKQLSALEWELKQALGRYTEENPKVIDLLDRIASLKAVIANGGDEDTPENVYAINPVRETLLLKQLDNRDVISIKAALARSMKESLDDNRARLESLTKNYRTYSVLVQERDSLTDLLNNLRNRVEEARIFMQGDNSDFDLIEGALPPSESNPTVKKLIAIAGAVLGGGFGIFVALLLEFIDPRVKTRREVIGLTCSDRVYEIHSLPEGNDGRAQFDQPDSDIALIIRRILNNLESELSIKQQQLLPITSVERVVGRSSLAWNLGVVSNHKEHSTLLVDADLSASAGTRSIDNADAQQCEGVGLAEYLTNELALDQLAQIENAAYLHTVSAGQNEVGRNAILKLSSGRMRMLLQAMGQQQRVILDLPPVSRYEPVFELLSKVGHTILVVRSGQTKKADLKQFAERAERAGIEILAVVLTDVAPDLSNEADQFSLTD